MKIFTLLCRCSKEEKICIKVLSQFLQIIDEVHAHARLHMEIVVIMRCPHAWIVSFDCNNRVPSLFYHKGLAARWIRISSCYFHNFLKIELS